MNYVRTTITLPADTHEYLMTQSFKTKSTLGELIDTMVKNNATPISRVKREKHVDEFIRFCKKMSKKYGPIDAVAAIREDRDHRDDKYL